MILALAVFGESLLIFACIYIGLDGKSGLAH